MPSSRSKSVIAIGLLLVCVVIGYFIFSNLLPAYNLTKNNLTKAETDHTQLNEALSSVQNFVNNFKNKSLDLNKANLSLPNKNVDLPNFLADLQQLASASGVSLSNLQTTDVTPATGQPTQENAIEAVDVNIIASANFASLSEFLLNLENSLRLIDVYHVTIRGDQNSTGSSAITLLQYQIKMYIYYQK